MFEKFSGKVALVTGGSSGIGRAAAIAFGRENIKVAVVANHNVAGGEETCRIIRENGGEAIFIQADMGNENQISYMMKKVLDTYGRIDYAFNNAAIGGTIARFEDYPSDILDKVLDVNFKGYFKCMQAEIKIMEKQGGGVIVNTSSINGLVGCTEGAGYIACKHAIVGMTKCAALENALKNIRINCVCPGCIDTPMNPVDNGREAPTDIPMHRYGRPEEVASLMLYLCSDGASYITGTAIPVDGGWVAK